MGYDCVVCIKQVPDTKRLGGQAMKDDGTVNRAALPAIFNPEDLNALELALDIRDRFGGSVTVMTMGLPKACDVLREALFRGADRAILITDRRAAGSDTLATSYILACAVRRLSPDLVVCGRQAIDGDTAQVGPQLAEKIDFTLVTYLEELVALEDQAFTAKRNLGNGFEVVAGKLPALFTVLDSANVPRAAAARRIMKCKKARCRGEIDAQLAKTSPTLTPEQRGPLTDEEAKALEARGLLIQQWTLEDISADLAWCGLKGSPTKVHRVQSIVLAGGAYKEFAPTDAGATLLIHELIADHTIG